MPKAPKISTCIDLTLTNPLARKSLETQLEEVTRINDTIRERLRKAIKVGFDKGESVDEIADRLLGKFKATKSRARTIARTEVNRAANTGHYLQAQANFGTAWDKQWISARDARVRDSHKLIDGQIRRQDQKFSNGLTMPHQAGAPAKEVVNCRCVLAIKPRSKKSQKLYPTATPEQVETLLKEWCDPPKQED